jgi:hypothetical protein
MYHVLMQGGRLQPPLGSIPVPRRHAGNVIPRLNRQQLVGLIVVAGNLLDAGTFTADQFRQTVGAAVRGLNALRANGEGGAL